MSEKLQTESLQADELLLKFSEMVAKRANNNVTCRKKDHGMSVAEINICLGFFKINQSTPK